MESENKNRIQNNVGDRTDQYGEHSGFCESLGCDEIIHAKSQLYKDSSYCIDIHVTHRIVDGVCTGAECKEKAAVSEKQDNSQDQGDDDLHGEAVSESLFGFRRVIFTHKDAGSGSASVSDKSSEGRYDHNKRHTDTYTGKGKSTLSGNMTNIDTIDDIVEHIDELCGNGRKCKLQKKLSDRLGS